MTEEGCSIKIELIKRNTEGSRSDFVRTLKKYGVNPESIMWCRYTPNEVKVKLARASGKINNKYCGHKDLGFLYKIHRNLWAYIV